MTAWSPPKNSTWYMYYKRVLDALLENFAYETMAIQDQAEYLSLIDKALDDFNECKK